MRIIILQRADNVHKAERLSLKKIRRKRISKGDDEEKLLNALPNHNSINFNIDFL